MADDPSNIAPLQLWGGIECTINRVGDRFQDQSPPSIRASVEAALSLGLSALRYPVLWERFDANPDWREVDHDLETIRLVGAKPIIGLIHHGSGPAWTSLTDDNFAEGLARHARIVAERYPWVEDWTPVNEPLTTARFSALYGLWYPHARDERLFWIALLNQIRGTRLAMAAIRDVNPRARLVQTEDLGTACGTPPLGQQVEFENARRWMTWDLLFGRVGPEHELWRRICSFGLEDMLEEARANPCPPDVVGINHYLTSDRYLDHRTERFDPDVVGGNGLVRYADVEAIRVADAPPAGLKGALMAAWQRYGATIAVTESHNSCTREEQMRWTADAWTNATALRHEGLDIVAVTAWALVGSRDWRSLLTRSEGHYECGAFDARGGGLRPTAMVPMLKAFAAGEAYEHPVLAGQGWWHRKSRLRFAEDGIVEATRPPVATPPAFALTSTRPLMIVGANGTLGRALAAACRARNIAYVALSRRDLDLGDQLMIAAILDHHRPWAVVNAAGWVRVDDAEANESACRAANTTAAVALAEACAARKLHYSWVSSDLVFDGMIDRMYVEDDPANPLNVYGSSKSRAEAAMPDALTIRTAAFFSPNDRYNFAYAVHAALQGGGGFEAAAGFAVTPTYVPDLVDVMLDLIIDDARGVWHLSNGDEVSWAGFARLIANACTLDAERIVPVHGPDPAWKAQRPRRSGLGTSRGVRMPSLDDALDRFARELEPC